MSTVLKASFYLIREPRSANCRPRPSACTLHPRRAGASDDVVLLRPTKPAAPAQLAVATR